MMPVEQKPLPVLFGVVVAGDRNQSMHALRTMYVLTFAQPARQLGPRVSVQHFVLVRKPTER